METVPGTGTPMLSGVELEYATLREEVLRRVDGRQQIVSITLTLAAAFLGVGWGAGSVALMIFPPLAVLLTASWVQNEIRIRHLTTYIHDNLETRLPGFGFERYSRERERETRFGAWPLDVLAIGGIFLFTQIMAVGLSLFRFSGGPVEWLLLAVDIGAIAVVLFLLEYVRRRSMT